MILRKLALATSIASVSLAFAPVQATDINQAALAGLTAMTQLNLITFEDLNEGGHDIEGKAWIGGNLNAGNAFTAGTGSSANPAQGAASSNYATLTVVGTMTGGGTVNLQDGSNGGSGTVGTGHYGIVVGGDSNKVNFNANGATVKVGGSMSSDENFGSNADISIRGFVNSITTGDGSTVSVGSVGTKIQAGNTSHVSVASGNVSGDVTVGQNSSVATAGSVGGLTLGSSSQAIIGGDVGQNLNLGQNDTVTIGGTYLSQNVNGLPNGTTVAVNGAPQTQNGIPAGWTFHAGATITAPATPPAIDLSSDKTMMLSNLTALSTQLNGLDAGSNVVTKVIDGSVYDALFIVTDTSNGYAAFDISSTDLFGARNVAFNLNGSSAPVVINVSGAGGTFSQGAGSEGVWDATLNQQVIWNFTDATTLSVTNILHGSVIATNATVSNSTPIEGSLVAKIFDQGGELHLGTFGGPTRPLVTITPPPSTSDVPEPASWMTMLAGFGVVGSFLRRQRRKGQLPATT